MSNVRQTAYTVLPNCLIPDWLGILAGLAVPAHAITQLQFFKNFFITGDYVVGGVGLQGKSTGTIHMTGVPAGADLVGAFLYWEALENTAMPSSSAGRFRDYAIAGLEIAPSNAPSCISGGSNPYLRVYRADVLRFLPFLQDPLASL